MKKSEQIKNLKKVFGSKSDLIDFDAHVDGRLTYSENKRILIEKARKKGINRKTKLTFKGSPIYYVDKAESFNSQRKLKARIKDGSTKAKKTFEAKTLTAEQFYKWKRNPRRYDIIGVDSKGEHIPKSKQRKISFADISKIDIL
jgi:hypothetical protein